MQINFSGKGTGMISIGCNGRLDAEISVPGDRSNELTPLPAEFVEPTPHSDKRIADSVVPGIDTFYTKASQTRETD